MEWNNGMENREQRKHHCDFCQKHLTGPIVLNKQRWSLCEWCTTNIYEVRLKKEAELKKWLKCASCQASAALQKAPITDPTCRCESGLSP